MTRRVVMADSLARLVLGLMLLYTDGRMSIVTVTQPRWIPGRWDRIIAWSGTSNLCLQLLFVMK